MKKIFIKIMLISFILLNSIQSVEAKTIKTKIENLRAPGLGLIVEVVKDIPCGNGKLSLSSEEKVLIEKLITNKDMTMDTEKHLLKVVRSQKNNLKEFCSKESEIDSSVKNRITYFFYHKVYFLNLILTLS